MASCERPNNVVVKGGGCPCILTMTGGTICRQLICQVCRILSRVVITYMTPVAGIGSVVVSVGMACSTIVGYWYMSTGNDIVLVVIRHGSRHPARIGGVTGRTVCTESQHLMVRVGCIVKICLMAPHTGIGGIGIPTGVTSQAIGCYGCVGSCQRPYVVVVEG